MNRVHATGPAASRPLPKRPRTRRWWLAACLSVAVVGGGSLASAETSSWIKRDSKAVPGAAAREQASPVPAAPDGGKARAEPLIKGPPAIKVPEGGDDAAYIAFDQGHFLTALRLAEKAATRGDPQAHTLIGRIYAEGAGVSRDDAIAARWYARAAELGDIEGAFSLGLMLAEGRGVEKNLELAGQMFERAALRGHALANYNLALLFLSGKGKPENPLRAAQHLTYAAEKGVPAAQYDLAALYQKGVGVQADAYQAARWLSRAADQGMVEAQFEYALVLLRGQGLNVDVPKAVSLLRAAAERGHAGAQNRLAHVLASGVRVSKDVREAAKWRLIARNGGIADPELDAMLEKLPSADLAAAERAARAWLERSSIELLQ